MSEKNRLSKIITRGGDKGETSLGGGKRVPKDSLRLETYGTTDELNSFVGMARKAEGIDGEIEKCLEKIQHDLFKLGGELCFEPDDLKKYNIGCITQELIDELEGWAGSINDQLEPLKEFILPAGAYGAAELHVCRTVARRAERLAVTLHREGGCSSLVVAYLNRLSDVFFIWSRWALENRGETPVLWDRQT